MLDRLLETIAPHICCSCGQNTGVLCEYCFFDILDVPFEQCLSCLRPTIRGNVCTQCRLEVAYDEAWVVGERQAALRRLVDQYKFERVSAAASLIARLIAARMPSLPSDTVVSYIPDIPAHRRLRGYDHMRRVAERVARLQELRHEGLLVRRTSLPQRGFSKQQRLTRQKNAFVAKKPINNPILLIDDIYTTGATIRAGVAALRAVSNNSIFVAVVARQPFDEQ